MVSLDLQDAYLQVPVHLDSRRCLRFCIDPRTYQFWALCFGLSSAPQVFTRVMTPISSIMHRHGFRILRYLDDWLVLGSSREEIVRARDFLLSLCGQLRVLVNLDKSSLHPSQTIDYLGMSLHTSPLRAFPTQTRIQKVLSLISEFTSSPAPPLPLWRSLLGVMSSLTPLIPGARLRMRSLQLRLRIAGPQQSDLALISWDDSCHRNLLWWSDASHLVGGVSLELPHPRLLLFTDASDTGWGATLGADHLSGSWTQDIFNVIPSTTASSWRFYMRSGVSFIFFAASLCPYSQTTRRLMLTSASKGAPGRRLSIRWPKPSSASAKPTMFCFPSLYLGSSMSLRIPSAAIPRCWDPSGLCVRRFARIFSAVGRSLSTCSPLP